MPQTEIVEQMAENSPLINLFVMAEELDPLGANEVANEFYGGFIDYDLTVRLLFAICRSG